MLAVVIIVKLAYDKKDLMEIKILYTKTRLLCCQKKLEKSGNLEIGQIRQGKQYFYPKSEKVGEYDKIYWLSN